jgi:hypothetical protein
MDGSVRFIVLVLTGVFKFLTLYIFYFLYSSLIRILNIHMHTVYDRPTVYWYS